VAFFALVRLSILRTIVARTDIASNIIFGVLLGAAMASLWRTLYENELINPEVTIEHMVTYAILGSVITTVFQTNVLWYGDNRIRSGDIVFDILRPISWQQTLLADFAGTVAAQALAVGVPVLAISALILGFQPADSLVAGIMFIPSLLLGGLLSFGLVFLIMLLAFRFTQVSGIESAMRGFRPLLTGALVPLWFLPNGVASAMEFLPFPGMTFTPLAIYVGEIEGTDMFAAVGMQIFWVSVLFGLGAFFAKRGVKNLSIQGG
jgi:ABC-type uncharacterized transport system permease subunit